MREDERVKGVGDGAGWGGLGVEDEFPGLNRLAIGSHVQIGGDGSGGELETEEEAGGEGVGALMREAA